MALVRSWHEGGGCVRGGIFLVCRGLEDAGRASNCADIELEFAGLVRSAAST
jgi:hypothetical protein